MRVEIKDFFEGINNWQKIVDALQGVGEFDVSDKDYDKVIVNSTKIFSNWTLDDADEFEDRSDEHRIVLHWVAGINTKQFLKME